MSDLGSAMVGIACIILAAGGALSFLIAAAGAVRNDKGGDER